LCVDRKEIVSFLDSVGQEYVTDSTNLVNDVMRNKIRLDVIPLLETINPNVKQSVHETSLNVTEASKVFRRAIERSCADVANGNIIDIERLKMQVSPEATLFHLLRPRGFSASVIRQVCGNLGAESGRIWQSETHELLLDRGKLIVEQRHGEQAKNMIVTETGTYVYGPKMKFTFSLEPKDELFVVDKSKNCACLDASKVLFPLKIRTVANGDRFVPFGMKRSKLVSDYMTDTKHTVFDKRNQLVMTDATGAIVWLVNERPDNRFRLCGTTISVLKIVLHG